MALDRWAVVRPDSPEPIIPSSTTRTPRPASARRKAVVRPAIPEPITQTSTDSSSESGGYAGGCASIHGEMVPSDSGRPPPLVMHASYVDAGGAAVNCVTGHYTD